MSAFPFRLQPGERSHPRGADGAVHAAASARRSNRPLRRRSVPRLRIPLEDCRQPLPQGSPCTETTIAQPTPCCQDPMHQVGLWRFVCRALSTDC